MAERHEDTLACHCQQGEPHLAPRLPARVEAVTSADVRAIAALARRARDLVEHPERDRADFLRRKAEVVARLERP